MLNILFLFNFVIGYSYPIHTYLGKIIDDNLKHNSIYPKIIETLEGNTISSVSSWADKIKRTKKFNYTKQLHYIDILECRKDNYTYDIIDKYCKNDCIVSIILDIMSNKQLIDKKLNLTNFEELKFLIHFIQDISQPMHVIGYERGGNSYKIILNKNNRNKTTNLHYIWDTDLPNYFIKKTNYTIPKYISKNITNIFEYSEYFIQILNRNIHIACRIMPIDHYIIFEEYYNDNEKYIKELFDNYFNLMRNSLEYKFIKIQMMM